VRRPGGEAPPLSKCECVSALVSLSVTRVRVGKCDRTNFGLAYQYSTLLTSMSHLCVSVLYFVNKHVASVFQLRLIHNRREIISNKVGVASLSVLFVCLYVCLACLFVSVCLL
jgi:hypothetical protein